MRQIRAEPDPRPHGWALARGARSSLPDPPTEARCPKKSVATRPRRPTTTTTRASHRRRRRVGRRRQPSSFPTRPPFMSPPSVPARRASPSAAEPIGLPMFWVARLRRRLLPLVSRTQPAGGDTYGAGRYLLDTAKGPIWVPTGVAGCCSISTFAYQPSCSYDPRWSCSAAPRENWLTMPIRGGERLRP